MADRELQNALSSGELVAIQLGGVTTAESVLIKGDNDAIYGAKSVVDANADYIANPKENLLFEPQATPPSYIEGQVYYDEVAEEFRAQGPFPDVEVAVGHSMHTHVVNNTPDIILKGTACRHDGVAAGIVQVTPALADSFVNAEVFGVASADIAIGAEGAITTFGEIRDMDTALLPTGVPLYLSDTVPGTYTIVKPSILTQVGGAVTQDASTGRLFVSIASNKNVPTVFAGMQGQTPGEEVYSVDAVVQDIDDYLTATTVVMGADLLPGVITLSNDGGYRMNFTSNISFPSSTSTRTVYVEFYDITNTDIVYTYPKNIPRDATEDGFSFSWAFDGIANEQFKIRIRSNVAIIVTLADVSFDIQSVSII